MTRYLTAMHNDDGPRMEVRALLAIVLSMLVLTVYQYFFVPAAEPLPAGATAPGAELAPEIRTTESSSPAQDAAPDEGQTRAPTAPASGRQAGATAVVTVNVAADRYEARVTNVGGRLESFVLVNYEDSWGEPLDLVNPGARVTGRLPLELETPASPAAAEEANSALFELGITGGSGIGTRRRATPSSPVIVTLRWADGAGWDVEKRIVFRAEGNTIEVAIQATAPGGLGVFLGSGLGLNAVDRSSRRVFLAEDAVVLGGEDLVQWAPGDLEGTVTLTGPTTWAGVESYYFLGAFLLEGPAELQLARGVTADWPQNEAAEDIELVSLAVRIPPGGLDVPIYLGPKKYDYLVAQGHELQRAVNFGWLSIIARPLLFFLNVIQGFVGNYGVAIILLTVLLRVAFWPLNQKAMVSMRKTQSLQPQMTAIRAKYQGVKDVEKRQKMNEEVMALYKREGVSPLGGCLPMLAQLPILFAFYRLLSMAVELRGAPFVLWIQDLSQFDPYLVLPLVMGGSMIVQQRMTPTAGVNPTQARMMRFMPVMFTVMFLWVPSGLVLYWTANNILGIGQQVLINKHIDKETQTRKRTRKQARKRGKKGQRDKK